MTYEKARVLIVEQYPPGHPAALGIEESEVLLAVVAGDGGRAVELADEVFAARMKNLADVLSLADEGQRLSYRS